ncbi:DNA polymerase sliding clamp [Natrialba phage PhiCh1]|uniref:DNA polymerase sliding clamp n=2 Tax=root TaxID=1 RepID=D3T2B0_NATMM|nr:DNA polymerase sliding clamp [Natrialba magadii]NP_665977.1 DNA polymerase sliding clamp [Natrialba phage PhiCh1]YP_010078085.1 DNA polymerase sliding clamp [Natrialba phage PhiCh1]AAM88733.1 putative proliferation cellular nuclear antigene [Natrialba phage PhiCh1]ADD07719.1 DNA polymerase sliding clamp phiCh1-VP59 [Natrialba magadii ATCC 43099]ELY22966.1 DNA polymerase sliding clamp [Natrialba magadii ATCC 43099]QBJ01236.1 DNA polymerase sliding clamp [Natrialba phage PhiCh1]
MFKAIATKSELESFTDPISQLVEECKVNLNEDGLHVRAVDPANVGMVESNAHASGFESYEADGGLIGLNVDRFEDVIGMANSGDLVHLELDEETRKLAIQIEGMEFTLALIDPDSIRAEPDIPDLDLTSEIVLEGRHIDRGIKAADMVSDHITLAVDEKEELFEIEAEGDTDDVHIGLERDDLIDLQVGPARSLFSLDYLKDMSKAIDAGDEVTIELGEEFPVKLAFTTEEGNVDVQYMLSPRIQSN